MLKKLRKFLKSCSLGAISLVITGLIIVSGVYFYLYIHLPDVSKLAEMTMQVPLRIYSSDGRLIGEFGEKKRIPVTLDQVPKKLIFALVDTEDQRFFEHQGVDFIGMLRAAKVVIQSGRKSQGASTITMQVARDFFLNPEKTYLRKFNEVLLALQIDRTFSKDQILTLYLNKVYFGQRAYGAAAAAQVYYGKSLDQLTISQLAMIAGLPQAPSRNNPIANSKAAVKRRDHVLRCMLEHNHITKAEYRAAINEPVNTSYHEMRLDFDAPYVAELARNQVISQFGEAAYDAGIKVYTTVDSATQQVANRALQNGLLAYDKRHGYRGAEANFSSEDRSQWREKLQKIALVNDLFPAVVQGFSGRAIEAMLVDGRTITIEPGNLTWPNAQLKIGDVIRVQPTADNRWRLTQVPQIQGALVALNPRNGAILSMVGGYSYAMSSYNRAIQAGRQPGSGFKPFIYAAALNKGLTLATVINDAPVVMMNPATKDWWRPQNDNPTFNGPTRLREALVNSRNLVSIRVLQEIGIPYTLEYLKNFGFSGDETPAAPSLALGTGQVTPLKMAAGFAVFANGGYQVTPYVIDKIIDQNKKVVFQANPSVVPEQDGRAVKSDVPFAPRVITPQNAYLLTKAMQDVIAHGTGVEALALKRSDIAGKTGTTNNKVDAWFSGFNGDVVATVWVGFDQPQSTNEYGAQAAIPIWIQFMQFALAGKPLHSMAQPDGITTARIDPETGLLARPGQKDAIFEIFTTDTVPKKIAPAPTAIFGTTPSSGSAPAASDSEQPLF